MQVLKKCRNLATSFYAKLFVVLLLVIPAAALVGDWIYSPLAGPTLERKAPLMLDEFDERDLPADEVLRSMSKLGLSWLYVSDTAGNVSPKYKSFAPDLDKFPTASGSVNWHGQRYFDVAVAQGNRIIHGGFRTEPLWDLLHGLPVPFAYTLTIISSVVVAILISFYLLISAPLAKLPGRLHKTLNGLPMEKGGLGMLASSQVSGLDQELNELVTSSRAKMVQEVNDAKNDLKEVMARERSQKFCNTLIAELHEADSTDAIFHAALHKVHDRFSQQVPVGLGYTIAAGGGYVLQDHYGMASEETAPLRKLKKCDAFIKPLESGLSSSVPTIADLDLPRTAKYNSIFIAPLVHRGKAQGVLVFLFDADEAGTASMQPMLKEVAECTSRVLPTMIAYEAEMEANRSDEMTGVTKIKYLENHLEKLRTVMRQDERISALLIEGDAFMTLNTQYGKQTGNDLIKELCRLIVQAVTPAELTGGTLPQHVASFRVGAAGFLVLIRMCDSKKASLIAERLRKFIEQYRQWPGGVPGWTVSVSHSTLTENVDDLSLLLPDCEVGRDYLRQQKKTNSSMASSVVPKTFRQKHQGNELGGTLTIFQPAALLQSLANTARTGLMEVASKTGNKIIIYVENGAPKKARLKKLNGNDSIVEFVATFEEGDFNFREFRADIASESMSTELMGLGGAEHDVTKPLEGLLLDGALAQDLIAAARTSIPQMGLYLIRELKASDSAAWDAVKTIAEPPTEQEVAAMNDIVKLGAGASTLQEIVSRKMDHMPTHVSMRAAQLLYEHKLIKLSPVKMLATF